MTYFITIFDYDRNTAYVHDKVCTNWLSAKHLCESICRNCTEQYNGININDFEKFYKKDCYPNNRGPSYYFIQSTNVNSYKVKIKQRVYGYLYNDIVIKKFMKVFISYLPNKNERCIEINFLFEEKEKFDKVMEELLKKYESKNLSVV